MNANQFAQLILQTPLIEDNAILDCAAQGVLDYLASSLAARDQKEITQFAQWIEQESGKPVAWLVGKQHLATARQAALFNGLQAHLLDYDDVHAQVRGHPSAVILSALFASLNLKTLPKPTALLSSRFLTAYVIGVEVMAILGKSLNPGHYEQGWHSTATFGALGAVAAICYLHNEPFLDQAFALAATQTGGLRLLFGTPIKALHAGMAAQAAIQAIQWLQAGLKAEKDFLDTHLGFTAVYGKGKALDLSHWGSDWQITQLCFKTYPYCSAAAYIADACYALQPEIGIEEIESITLNFSPKGDAALIYPQPTVKSQGRFSGEYIAAQIFLQKPLDFAAFDNKPIEAEVMKFMQKIDRTFEESPLRFGEVKVRLKNEKFLAKRIFFPKGSPQNPYSQAEIAQKLSLAVGEISARQITDSLSQWRNNKLNTNEFIEQLRNIL